MSQDLRKPRTKTETKTKSQSPQVKMYKSKTKERVQQKTLQQQYCPTVKKLNPKSQSQHKKQQFKPTPPDTTPKFYIGLGNNEGLVKRVMAVRQHWKETSDSSSMFVNLKWQQSDRGYRFERLIQSQYYKQLVNHFEHHKEISNKQYLIKNLTIHCEKHKLNVFDYTPLTFVIDFSDENCDYNITQFLKTYEQFAPKKPTSKYMLDIKRRLRGSFINGYQRDSQMQYTKINMLNTFLSEDSTYLWLLKPTFLNRGRGIHVLDNLETLVQVIQEFQEGLVEKSHNINQDEEEEDQKIVQDQKPTQDQKLPQDQKIVPEQKIVQDQKMVQSVQSAKKVDPNSYIRQQASGPSIIKSHAFVIQKYVERPALINKRKFDIRVWGLITQDLDAYFFQEGYIRTSSEDFSYNIENQFVHLTNNAIQKYSNNYGQFEAGNQMSFKDYQEYLNKEKVDTKVTQLIEKMKERIWMTFSSVKNKINVEDRKFCFEIFGFDFILDNEFNVWLIEVNTNPCIEESSPLLAMYIPRMLDDAFKLTVDILFPPSISKQSNPQIQVMAQINEESHSEFPVTGYQNDENMWFQLGCLNDRLKKKKK